MLHAKLSMLVAVLIVALHVFEDPAFGLALCFAAFAAFSLELLLLRRKPRTN